MKATKYSRFCNKIFGNIYSRRHKDKIEKKNIALAQANVSLDYDAYFSVALMNTIIVFITTLIFVFSLYIVIPSVYTRVFIIILPSIVTLCIAATYLYLPKYYITKRARNIELFLPYAINFISSMAVAGVSPAEIFQSLSVTNVYGREIQTEAKKIAKEITVMGTDNITAIRHAIEISPSKKFKAFLQGIIGTIQSGSDLHEYLSNITEKYMQDDLLERKKDLDLLGVIAEVFVISVIAFPIFLVIIITMMGFFGGSIDFSLSILMLFSFVILPIVYAGFYVIIKSTSVEEISKVQLVKRNYNIKQYFKENRIPFLILLLSSCLLTLLFWIIHLLSYYGYLDNSMYLYVDSIFLSVLLIIGPIGIYKYMEVKKKKQIQERLPEFLVGIGDSLSTGMTIFEAIKVAEKGHYGELDPNIKKMKTQLSWNVSVIDVFNDFAAKMKSVIIQRIVITINRGIMMGGSTQKIFKAAAREVNQINQLEDQRKTNMSIYTIVILLCFFVFLAIILILNRTIFTSYVDLQASQLQQLGAVSITNLVDPIKFQYVLFSFVFVQSIGAGVLAGFMTDGKLSSGVRYSCALGLVSFFVFKFLF